MPKTYVDISPTIHKIRICHTCGCELFVQVFMLFTDQLDVHSGKPAGYFCVECGSVYSKEGKGDLLEHSCYERVLFWPPLNIVETKEP